MSHSSSSRYQRSRALARTESSSSSSGGSRSQHRAPTGGHFGSQAADSPPYVSPYSPVIEPSRHLTVPALRVPATSTYPSGSRGPATGSMSTYSSASDQDSIYSSPGPQDYQVVTAGMMANPRSLSATDKERLLRALRTHSINTLPELRRIEKIFNSLGAANTTQGMKNAWVYYVNSNNLLNELRGLTKDYPFSSECLNEAKARVSSSPTTEGRSQNYCWLVLERIKSQALIQRHARLLAVKPAMWGGQQPSAAGVEQLAAACTNEWTRALNTLMRHWDASGL